MAATFVEQEDLFSKDEQDTTTTPEPNEQTLANSEEVGSEPKSVVDSVLPEKYKGKTVEDIVKMHQIGRAHV